MSADRDLPEKNLVDYVAVLWRRKFTILLTVVVAVAIAVGIDFARTKQYTSTASLLLTIPGISANSSTAQAYATQPNVPTDIELIQSAQVQDAVTKKIGSAPGVAVTQVGTTNVVSISATSPSADQAAKVANAYATSYLEVSSANYLSSINAQVAQYQSQINGLQTQIDQINGQLSDASGSNVSNLESQLTSLLAQQQSLKTALASLQQSAANASGGQVVTPATPSSSPSSPKRTRDALIALAGGLLLGLGLALLRDYFDDRIRSREDLEEAVPAIPIVGMIPEVSDWRNRRKPFLVELARPRSPAAEAYRSLRTSIQFMSLDHPVKLLQITSGAAAEGKTTTSANLAVAMAEAGTQVVLVSCDLRKPRIHEFFDLAERRGPHVGAPRQRRAPRRAAERAGSPQPHPARIRPGSAQPVGAALRSPCRAGLCRPDPGVRGGPAGQLTVAAGHGRLHPRRHVRRRAARGGGGLLHQARRRAVAREPEPGVGERRRPRAQPGVFLRFVRLLPLRLRLRLRLGAERRARTVGSRRGKHSPPRDQRRAKRSDHSGRATRSLMHAVVVE